jgi:Flp pilus assembly protein TadG
MREKIVRRKRSKGSAMVELALVFPLLATLLIVVADLAVFLFLQQALVERARSAARWGAVSDPSNSGAIVNMVLYARAVAPTGTQPDFGLARAMVQVAAVDAGTDNYRLVVTISGYSFKLFSPFMGGKYPGRTIEVSVPLGPYS